MKPVDEPYTDAAYDFLRPLVGDARVLALGEWIHGAHEPLKFRNQAIRYAVTRLGFTAVAIESGFTEGVIVDRFVQGGPGNIDSVLWHGFTNGFDQLGENQELVLWLRDYNARAVNKVHFYGIDVPGLGGHAGTAGTLVALLDYLGRVAPSTTTNARSTLGPLIDRFTAAGYLTYSAAERERLRLALDAIQRALLADSSAHIRATSPTEYASTLRTLWNAQLLRDRFIISGTMGRGALEAVRHRDSVMFENARWVLALQGENGRMVVFQHNGHVMNVPLVFPAMGPPMTMLGQRLKGWLGPHVATIGTITNKYVGLGPRPSDRSSFEKALDDLKLGNYALDLRTADSIAEVAVMLRTPWLTWIHSWYQPFVPREATDMFVVFDQVTASKDHQPSP